MEYLAIVPILGVVIVAHELGHFFAARSTGITVEELAIGFPPRLLSWVRGGVRYSLNAIPLGAYVRLLGEEDPSLPGSFASKPRRSRALVLAAGSLANLGVAVIAFALAYGTGWPDPSALVIKVVDVLPGSPAEESGVRAGDVLRAMDGQPIRLLQAVRDYTQQRAGETIELTIVRQGQELTRTIMLRASWPEGQGPLGVRFQSRALPTQHDPLSSAAFGVRQTFHVVSLTLVAPVLAIRGDLPLYAARPIGLPGMTQLAADATTAVLETGWIFPVLILAGVLSAGIAIANLLPLPALDGGRLLFVAVEAIRGRRMAPEREGLIHAAGVVLLLSLIVLISLHDLTEPLPPIDWGLP